MGFAPQYAGPHDPVTDLAPRRPGWIRRTTTIDTTRPEGLDRPSAVDARGRDLLTRDDGVASVLAETSFEARLENPVATLLELRGTGTDALCGLVGLPVRGGFRARAAEAIAALASDDPSVALVNQLLDDLPGATLVAGFAVQHAATVAGRDIVRDAPATPTDDGPRSPGADLMLGQADLCSGWAAESIMFTTLRSTGTIMTPLGPTAPPLVTADDRDAWHDVAPLPPHGMRRLRRLDLGPLDADGTCAFDGHFRDSHVDGVGHETCVHEYVISGRIDAEGSTVVAIETQARVLPWQECPGAVASAQRVVGVPLHQLRPMVRAEMRGASTCTHLNDTLRSLHDVPDLLALRARGVPHR